MAFNPEEITKEHVLSAVEKIENEKLNLIDSTKYDVIINGQKYPPKEIMRYAHQEMNGEFIWQNPGGPRTNDYLSKMGFEIVEKLDSETNMFDWIPIYSEIAHKLLEYSSNRKLLIEMLVRMKDEELFVVSLDDRFSKESEETFIMEDIDPFTFFANFNRSTTWKNRIAVLERLKSDWGLKSELPKDFSGLPALTPQNAWFFGFKYLRKGNDIESLWELFSQIMKSNPKEVDGNLFNECLKQRGIKQNITAGLFWVQPKNYFPLVGGVAEYLSDNFGINEIRIDKLKYDGYLELLETIKSKTDEPFYEISHKAYMSSHVESGIIKNESLIEEFLKSDMYAKFKGNGLSPKIKREQEAWDLIKLNEGKITSEIVSKFMDVVDTYDGRAGWFGLMLMGNNRKQIINAPSEKLNGWISTLLFSDLELEDAITKCNTDLKIPGASYGLITLLLYLSDPEEYNVFVQDTAQNAFDLITTVDLKKHKNKIKKYNVFNETIKLIRDQYDLKPQEMDWFLNNINIFLSKKNSTIENTKGERVIMNLNTILYGPPGTGKTYHTVAEAVKIIENLTDVELNKKYPTRTELKKQYDIYRGKEQIQFVTFHQSFNYEDFVEGIKPTLNNTELEQSTDFTNDLQYNIEDGIFKRMALRALASQKQKSSDPSLRIDDSNFENVTYYKMSLGNTAISDDNSIYDYCIQNGVICLGWGSDLDFTGAKDVKDIKEIYSNNGYKIKERNDYSVSAIKMFLLWMNKGDIVFISNGNYKLRAVGKITSDYFYNVESPIRHMQFRKVKWLLTDVDVPAKSIYYSNFSQQTIYQMYTDKVNTELFTGAAQNDGEPDRFVLIIDEINRGNIAATFGELITLLEEDKRYGANESVSVQLPYSKEIFQVPNNLYLLGTMNTADRSVEALDTALRRRFTFIEKTPQEHILNQGEFKCSGIDLEQMLLAINSRLELLLNKDHKIGHSYFMGIQDKDSPLQELKYIFEVKIIPLLEEYFYGNPQRIGMVLGEDFVKSNESKVKLKSGFDEDDIVIDDKKVFQIVIPDDLESYVNIYEEK